MSTINKELYEYYEKNRKYYEEQLDILINADKSRFEIEQYQVHAKMVKKYEYKLYITLLTLQELNMM